MCGWRGNKIQELGPPPLPPPPPPPQHHHQYLNLRVVGAPQMISQPVSSIFLCSPLPSGTWWTPGLSIPWCYLQTSSSVSLVFFPFSLCLARWFSPDMMNGRHARPHHCSLRLFTMVRRFSCGPIACWILARTSSLVFIWDAQYFEAALHFHGLYSSLELCCEGPWFTSIQEAGCDKEALQTYFGTEINTPVIQNWFQRCQCCCCLCYPWKYLRLGTLISYNWVQVLEACDCLKLLSIYFNVCVDATGVVCRQLDLLGTVAVGCGGFVETLN